MKVKMFVFIALLAVVLVGGMSSSAKSQSCIAIAAFDNNSQAPAVAQLREWRDNVLQKSWLGRVVTSAYYNGIGQCGAYVLAKVPSLKPVARFAISEFLAACDLPSSPSRKVPYQASCCTVIRAVDRG